MKGQLKRTALSIAVMVLTSTGSAVAAYAQATQSFDQLRNFGVNFSNCVESIGVTVVPTASARAHVPNEFILVGDGKPVTPVVVRTARCGGIGVASNTQTTGEIVQIGAIIVPPDGTGDINNYTIWYYTSDVRLALRLLLAGVSVQYVPTLNYDINTHDGTLQVRVPLPGVPRLQLMGSVIPSTQPLGSFVANWWQAAFGGTIKMSTTVPNIKIGVADLVMTTSQQGPLGQLIGASSTGFPIIQQFNTFDDAHMQVGIVP